MATTMLDLIRKIIAGLVIFATAAYIAVHFITSALAPPWYAHIAGCEPSPYVAAGAFVPNATSSNTLHRINIPSCVVNVMRIINSTGTFGGATVSFANATIYLDTNLSQSRVFLQVPSDFHYNGTNIREYNASK